MLIKVIAQRGGWRFHGETPYQYWWDFVETPKCAMYLRFLLVPKFFRPIWWMLLVIAEQAIEGSWLARFTCIYIPVAFMFLSCSITKYFTQ